MINPRDLKVGDRVEIQITGDTGQFFGEVIQTEETQYNDPYLRVLNADGSVNQSYKSFTLKSCDYIIMGWMPEHV